MNGFQSNLASASYLSTLLSTDIRTALKTNDDYLEPISSLIIDTNGLIDISYAGQVF